MQKDLMLISRTRFFVFLLFFLVAPFIGQKLYWLMRSKRAIGIVYFMGHDLNTDGSVSSHQIIFFRLGRDSVIFTSNVNFKLRDSTVVPVRYEAGNPHDARIDKPASIWGDTLVFALSPIGIWLVLLLTPNRFDPLVPWRSKVDLRWQWPFIRVVTPTARDKELVNIRCTPVNKNPGKIGGPL